MTNTSEKKCEACKAVPHNGHNTDMYCCRHTCQKEQPEQEVHDKLMNMALDHAKSAAYPPVLFTPPQELRQEEAIQKFPQQAETWEKTLMCIFGKCPHYLFDHELQGFGTRESCRFRGLESTFEETIAFIKNVEQKAREEERAKASLCIFNSCSDCQILSERYKTQNHKVVLSNNPKSP